MFTTNTATSDTSTSATTAAALLADVQQEISEAQAEHTQRIAALTAEAEGYIASLAHKDPKAR